MLIGAQEGVALPDEEPTGRRLVRVPKRNASAVFVDHIVGDTRLNWVRLLADDIP
jgi:hypothetical protein